MGYELFEYPYTPTMSYFVTNEIIILNVYLVSVIAKSNWGFMLILRIIYTEITYAPIQADQTTMGIRTLGI